LISFLPFWYNVSRKIWQPCLARNKADLSKEAKARLIEATVTRLGEISPFGRIFSEKYRPNDFYRKNCQKLT
jgi:hypothetical protein